MCSTLMFGTLKLGLIDLQSAPQMDNWVCLKFDAAKVGAAQPGVSQPCAAIRGVTTTECSYGCTYTPTAAGAPTTRCEA